MLRKYQLNFKLNLQDYSSVQLFSEFITSFRPELERCPSCNAVGRCRRYGHYGRSLTDYDHGKVIDLRIKVPRVMCSCGHTHGAIPDHIVPYRWYSLPFILHILDLYFSGAMTIEAMLEEFGFSHSTLYRWISVYAEHKIWWLGALQSDRTTAIAFLTILFGYPVFSDLTRRFFLKTLRSFLQSHSNPANCDHLPPGWLPVQGAPT